MHACLYTCVCVYVYIHIYIYIYMHICAVHLECWVADYLYSFATMMNLIDVYTPLPHSTMLLLSRARRNTLRKLTCGQWA